MVLGGLEEVMARSGWQVMVIRPVQTVRELLEETEEVVALVLEMVGVGVGL